MNVIGNGHGDDDAGKEKENECAGRREVFKAKRESTKDEAQAESRYHVLKPVILDHESVPPAARGMHRV